ncbi:hypothetical protein HK101_004796 [Irineochytrium annulatum]|nr:hypothetical protein HK101_004796 [Irineochytrium annulatum]
MTSPSSKARRGRRNRSATSTSSDSSRSDSAIATTPLATERHELKTSDSKLTLTPPTSPNHLRRRRVAGPEPQGAEPAAPAEPVVEKPIEETVVDHASDEPEGSRKRPSSPKESTSKRRRLALIPKEPASRVELLWTAGFTAVTIFAFVTRTYRIDHPDQVVFDEVHFGKFASYYLRGEYYFDVHPPLGKLMLAAMGSFVGYDGHFLFEDIGMKYRDNRVPYVGLRLMPATCGALVVSLCFGILRQMGCDLWTVLIASVMLIFDIALITQTRLILLDSMLMVFGVWTIYNWIRFYKERFNPFSFDWWFWLTWTGVALGCACGVKMVGLFTVATVGIAVLCDLWRILDIKRGTSVLTFAKHFGARALCLIVLPIALYLSFFYIHFELLPKSGPGDAFMSHAFRAELQGSDVMASTPPIPYFSKVTFKHRETTAYLHSHADRYPRQYDDGRISSQGQQVTGYPHKDPNNVWELRLVSPNEPVHEERKHGGTTVRYLLQQDVFQLYHVNTRSLLRTHDVASPLTKTNTEVTTITEADVTKAGGVGSKAFNDTLFTIETLNLRDGEKVRAIGTHFKLKSVPLGVVLNIQKGGLLPAWGFGQAEVNGDKNQAATSAIWYIEDVKHERIVNGKEVDDTPTLRKVPVKTLSFFRKFWELHGLMIHHNAGLTTSHPYSSRPLTWPFVLRGISFWEVLADIQQIYLLGNPPIWWYAIAGTLAYGVLWVLDRIFERRGWDWMSVGKGRKWWDRGCGFLFTAWAFHWLPFFLMERSLFLHHYLPSFIFSVLVASFTLEAVAGMLGARLKGWTKFAARCFYYGWTAAGTGACVAAFVYFSPFCYGSSFQSREAITERKWLKSWDFQHAI